MGYVGYITEVLQDPGDIVGIVEILQGVGIPALIVLIIVIVWGIKWVNSQLKKEKDEVREESKKDKEGLQAAFKKEIELLKERQKNTDEAQNSTLNRLEEADKQINTRFKGVHEKIEKIDNKHNDQYQKPKHTQHLSLIHI